jgi:hypothetical protein
MNEGRKDHDEEGEGVEAPPPSKLEHPPEHAPVEDHTFLSAGKAIFTVTLPSGRHYTYRVVKADECTDGKVRWFVGLLTRPDNYAGYTYMGVYNPVLGQIFRTNRSKFSEDAKCWWAFERVLDFLHRGTKMEEGMEIWHVGKCGRCGRRLTDPDSIRIGIGPECRGRLGR